AGLQAHVRGGAPGPLARRGERVHFRVGPARSFVPAFSEDRPIARDDAADPRVGRGRVQPALRELQRAGHQAMVIGGKHYFLTGCCTSLMASWKSSTPSKLR